MADLRAEEWIQRAKDFLASGRLTEAEEALANAQHFCEEGSGDPRLRASLCERMSSLRMSQSRFEQAIALADEAGHIYNDCGEPHLVARTMVQKATVQLYSNEAEAAVWTLNRAIPMIDPESDPHLLLAACHNLIRCYIDMAQPEQALSLYFEAQDLYQELQDPLAALHASWQEGQLLRDLGCLRAAEAALLKARQGFLERELSYEVGLVLLDLTAVYVHLGETGKRRKVASEAASIFKSLGANREVWASLLQLAADGATEP